MIDFPYFSLTFFRHQKQPRFVFFYERTRAVLFLIVFLEFNCGICKWGSCTWSPCCFFHSRNDEDCFSVFARRQNNQRRPAMQNAITTNIFKAPVCWCLKRFLNQPSCNESIFYYFQTFLQNVLKESGFGTKGKFSSLPGGKFLRRDENVNLSGYFFHLITKHSF